MATDTDNDGHYDTYTDVHSTNEAPMMPDHDISGL